jgi:CelD/BcsL family acetyltransferase involved in cellulose biosynthesis
VTLDEFRAQWSNLGRQARSIFATYEWADTWWRHFGDGELRVRVVPEVAVLPLYVGRSGPFRLLRFIGHGPADELGPVCPPDALAEAAVALREAVRDEGFHLFLGEALPGHAPWSDLLGGRQVERQSSPVLTVGGRTWDELQAAWSRNLREQVGRFERRLERERGLRYRLADDETRLEADLDILFRLHRARWPGSPWFAGAEDFHRAFAAIALERGWLRLWFLELDEQPVAAWYGFRFGDAEVYYQSGRNPAFAAHRVGFVLLAHTIREAVEDGVAEYRFGAGGEAYKYRFADADPGIVTVGGARGAIGAAALAARTLRRRLRRAAT